MRWILPLLIACTPDAPGRAGPTVDDCATGGDTELLVLSRVAFPREEPTGVSVGFDLDGDVSVAGGAGGCGQGDFVSPDGTPGIDNGLARLRPALDLTEGAALDLIVQEAVNSGGLLVMVELADVEDPVDDACVDVSVLGGLGLPMVGSDGVLLPGQTFDPDPSVPPSVVQGAAISAGRLEDGPVDLALPFTFLDADVVFHVGQGRMRLERDAEGRYAGIVGGAVPIVELTDLAHNTGISAEVEDLLDGLLGLIADIDTDGDGVCESLSATIEFDAVQAFFYPEGAR